jgi:hypothetical protein
MLNQVRPYTILALIVTFLAGLFFLLPPSTPSYAAVWYLVYGLWISATLYSIVRYKITRKWMLISCALIALGTVSVARNMQCSLHYSNTIFTRCFLE